MCTHTHSFIWLTLYRIHKQHRNSQVHIPLYYAHSWQGQKHCCGGKCHSTCHTLDWDSILSRSPEPVSRESVVPSWENSNFIAWMAVFVPHWLAFGRTKRSCLCLCWQVPHTGASTDKSLLWENSHGQPGESVVCIGHAEEAEERGVCAMHRACWRTRRKLYIHKYTSVDILKQLFFLHLTPKVTEKHMFWKRGGWIIF